MTRIELSTTEAGILKEMLETRLSDLRMEISHTDQQDYREMLKIRKATLEHVLAQIGTAPTMLS